MGHTETVLQDDQGTGMEREGEPLATATAPMICYSRSMGQYAELCSDDEKRAAARAFGADCDDASVIRLAGEDSRHPHQSDGSCIIRYVIVRSNAAAEMRVRMARGFISGHEMVFV